MKDGKLQFNADGTPKMVKKPIKEDEILNHADYGDHVVVVTKDGKKFHGKK
ncbi:MAG: hypothetical protein GXP10_10685 [Gammaproteobacteria bacterium]|nr:hypothetical protein [Gammaproteobacteria bacterium]